MIGRNFIQAYVYHPYPKWIKNKKGEDIVVENEVEHALAEGRNPFPQDEEVGEVNLIDEMASATQASKPGPKPKK